MVIEEELSLEETAGIDGAVDNSEELFEKLAEIEFYGGVLEEQKGDSAGEAVTFASADPDFAAVNYLSGINLELYNANLPELKKISSGSRESAVIEITDASLGKADMTATADELGVSILTVKDGKTVISSAINKQDFDYIKIGPFIKHLGPLKNSTTNQRLYRRNDNGEFEDITSRFWKK